MNPEIFMNIKKLKKMCWHKHVWTEYIGVISITIPRKLMLVQALENNSYTHVCKGWQ